MSLTACAGSDDRSAPPANPHPPLKLGHSAVTAGVDGRGRAENIPDTVVYDGSTSFGSPEDDLFAGVNCRSGNRTKSRVTTTADEGGFRRKSPDGSTVEARNSKAATSTPPVGFSEGGPVLAPRTWHQDVAVFDITAAAKDGTLIYVDGDDTAFGWKIPATDSGAAVPALEFALR